MTGQERIAQLRAKLDKRLKRERPVSVGRKPRYDAVFFEGTAWLDRLATEPEAAGVDLVSVLNQLAGSGESFAPEELWVSPRVAAFLEEAAVNAEKKGGAR